MNQKKEPYDSGNPAHVQKAKLAAYTDRERMKRGFEKLAADPDCRFVIQSFLGQAGPFRDGFDPNPYTHAHNGGWKSAGLWWINNGLLHDRDFIAKIQSDDGSQAIVRQDDGPDDNHDDDGSST